MTKVRVGAHWIEVVSDEDAEKVDYVICMPADTPTPFTDNLTGFCCECGIKVMYRWHMPTTPPKICMNCALKNLAAEKKRRPNP